MDTTIKMKIGQTAFNILMDHGVPAFKKFAQLLEDRNITLEDIENLHGELDSEDYFKKDS